MPLGDSRKILYRISATAETSLDLAAEIESSGLLDAHKGAVALFVHNTDQVLDLVEDSAETEGLTVPVTAAADENFPLWSGPVFDLMGGAHVISSVAANYTILVVPMT